MSDEAVETMDYREQLARIDRELAQAHQLKIDAILKQQKHELAPWVARIENRKAWAAIVTSVAAVMATVAGLAGFIIGRGVH